MGININNEYMVRGLSYLENKGFIRKVPSQKSLALRSLAVEFAKAGINVIGIDIDDSRIQQANQGKSF